jgi:hypothetical protein
LYVYLPTRKLYFRTNVIVPLNPRDVCRSIAKYHVWRSQEEFSYGVFFLHRTERRPTSCRFGESILNHREKTWTNCQANEACGTAATLPAGPLTRRRMDRTLRSSRSRHTLPSAQGPLCCNNANLSLSNHVRRPGKRVTAQRP